MIFNFAFNAGKKSGFSCFTQGRLFEIVDNDFYHFFINNVWCNKNQTTFLFHQHLCFNMKHPKNQAFPLKHFTVSSETAKCFKKDLWLHPDL